REHLWGLHKYRGLAATCFWLTFGLTVFATLLTPRLYTASTRLELARQSPIQLRLEGNVLRLGDGDPSANGAATFLSTQVAALQSRDLAERVIRSRGLADSEAFLDPGSPRVASCASLGSTRSVRRRRSAASLPSTRTWPSTKSRRPSRKGSRTSRVCSARRKAPGSRSTADTISSPGRTATRSLTSSTVRASR